MANFDQSELALKIVCPGNDILYDDKEMPSIMVYIPKFRLCDVLSTNDTIIHPAFYCNGLEIPGFWVGKYESVHNNSRPYSLPGQDPANTASLDTFISYARAKGEGWHEITAVEWAAIALWCHRNGTEPKGNNNFGKDISETIYRAIPMQTINGQTTRVATGSGPITRSHDGTIEGIWDLNGNVWEWISGLRLVKGEVQIIKDNNASANTTDLSEGSSAWKAINAEAIGWDDLLIEPNGEGSTSRSVKLDYVSGKWKYVISITSSSNIGRECAFKEVTCDTTIGSMAQLLLQALAMLPDDKLTGKKIDPNYGEDHFWANNAATERCAFRGGYWNSGSSAGVFSVYLNSHRSNAPSSLGGRSAFVEIEN